MLEYAPWIKGLHVLSVVMWLAGMTTTVTLLSMARNKDAQNDDRKRLGDAARGVYLRLQAPGMGIAIATGIFQMFAYINAVPEWMKTNIWIHWKIMFVIALMVIDHMVMRQALKLRREPGEAPKALAYHLTLGLAFAATAIFLATLQPVK